MKIITLDTNAYSALITGDLAIKTVIENANSVLIPIIVFAELLYGFKNGNREEFNTYLLNDFLSLPGVAVLHTTINTAIAYSQICFKLKKEGRPIPSNDIWIAAFAKEHDSTMVTYDRHFLHVADLKIWPGLTF